MAIVTSPPAEGNGNAPLLTYALPDDPGKTKSRSQLNAGILSHTYLSVKPPAFWQTILRFLKIHRPES
jgi:hypothetical protein